MLRTDKKLLLTMGHSMTDTSLGEALSAAIDGEASEFELRRVLRDLESDELRAQAFRYQLQGELLREEHNAFASIDLSGAIRASIDEELDDQLEVDQSTQVVAHNARFWQRPWAKAAVAASVTLAVILGVNTYNRSDLVEAPMVAATNGSSALVRTPATAPVNPVGAQSLLAGLELSQPATKVAPDQDRLAEAHQRQALRLESYVRQHTAQTVLTSAQGALPFARVASFDTP